MGFFKTKQEKEDERRKKEQEKILFDIKKKQSMIEKLEEEILMAGKMALKDGKLQLVDDKPAQQANIPIPPVAQASMQQPSPQYVQQNPFVEMPVERQMPQVQSMPQQQQQYQSQFVQQQKATVSDAMINIILTGNLNLQVRVPSESVSAFVADINTAIEEQRVLNVGGQFISGRQILMYNIE